MMKAVFIKAETHKKHLPEMTGYQFWLQNKKMVLFYLADGKR